MADRYYQQLLDSYVRIEESLSARLFDGVSSHLSPFISRVDYLASIGDMDGALQTIKTIELSSLFKSLEDVVKAYTRLSFSVGCRMVGAVRRISPLNTAEAAEYIDLSVGNLRGAVTIGFPKLAQQEVLQLMSTSVKADEPKPRVIRPFQSFIDDKGKVYFNTAASLHNSRVAAYGFALNASLVGVDSYRVNEQLDSKICPICSEMHGKTFKVSDALQFLDKVSRMSDPEELKAAQPWPKQDKRSFDEFRLLTSDQLVSKGWHTPPYHPRCRGVLAVTTKVPRLELVYGDRRRPTPVVTTREDLSLVGVGDDHLSNWNRLVPANPSEVARVLSGKDDQKLAVSSTPTAVTIALPGSRRSISVAETGVSVKAPDLTADYARTMYLLGKDLGKQSVSFTGSSILLRMKYGLTHTRGQLLSAHDELKLLYAAGTLSPEYASMLVDLVEAESLDGFERGVIKLPSEVASKVSVGADIESVLYVRDQASVDRFLSFTGDLGTL